MKNIFSVNITTGESETDKFVARKVSSDLERRTEEMDNTIVSIQKSASLPS